MYISFITSNWNYLCVHVCVYESVSCEHVWLCLSVCVFVTRVEWSGLSSFTNWKNLAWIFLICCEYFLLSGKGGEKPIDYRRDAGYSENFWMTPTFGSRRLPADVIIMVIFFFVRKLDMVRSNVRSQALTVKNRMSGVAHCTSLVSRDSALIVKKFIKSMEGCWVSSFVSQN